MSNIIVMAFSPRNIIGCFLKKRLTKRGRGSRAPQEFPLATPLYLRGTYYLRRVAICHQRQIKLRKGDSQVKSDGRQGGGVIRCCAWCD